MPPRGINGRPKHYAPTLATVRRKLRRQLQVTADALVGEENRPLACALVELMQNEVNTSITPAERERIVGELADELQQPA